MPLKLVEFVSLIKIKFGMAQIGNGLEWIYFRQRTEALIKFSSSLKLEKDFSLFMHVRAIRQYVSTVILSLTIKTIAYLLHIQSKIDFRCQNICLYI